MTFLVIGAQKCATSWLYYCLAEHPGLFLPPSKREVEYLGGALHRERGDAWYLDLITPPPGGPRVRGDVSVEYLWDETAPTAAARVLGEARIIVSLREPLERAVSSYYWNLRKGRLPADLTLEDALVRGIAWLRAREGGADAGAGTDPVTELVARSSYDVQLSRWLERFAPERFLVLDYGDIQRDPVRVLEGLYGFLGVAPIRPAALSRRPKRNSHVAPLLRLERLFPRNRLWAALMDQLHGLWPGRPPDALAELAPALRDEARAAFEPSMRRTAELLGRVPAGQRPRRPSFCSPPPGEA